LSHWTALRFATTRRILCSIRRSSCWAPRIVTTWVWRVRYSLVSALFFGITFDRSWFYLLTLKVNRNDEHCAAPARGRVRKRHLKHLLHTARNFRDSERI